jgi:hypothetical protein
VDDANVEVVDEHQNVGSGEGSSDADVVEAAGDAQGDAAGVVDAVAADSMVSFEAVASSCLGAGGVGGWLGGAVSDVVGGGYMRRRRRRAGFAVRSGWSFGGGR